MIDKEMIVDLVYNNPLSLLVIKDKETIDYINSLIPYSSAFEIECDQSPSYNEFNFMDIPDIMSVDIDKWEQRFRIPNGLKGIICLYNISTQLKLNSLLNPLSSIHYHVDCTDCYGDSFNKLILKYQDWILLELDTWLSRPDEATSRSMGSWFRPNGLQTLEFRLGEMTFDYKILLKRIIHCNVMVKKFKTILKVPSSTYTELDTHKILNYLKNLSINDLGQQQKINRLKVQLDKINTERKKVVSNLPTEEPLVIRNRVHIFKPLKED